MTIETEKTHTDSDYSTEVVDPRRQIMEGSTGHQQMLVRSNMTPKKRCGSRECEMEVARNDNHKILNHETSKTMSRLY